MAPDATGNLGSPGLRGLLHQPHLDCSEGGALLVRSAPWRLDRILIEVGYGEGLCVSELAGLTWSDVLAGDKGQVQLSVVGKAALCAKCCCPRPSAARCCRCAATPARMTPIRQSQDWRPAHRARRARHRQGAAARVGIEAPVSPPGFGTHTRATPSTAGPPCLRFSRPWDTATSLQRRHARPGSSSGLKLDPGYSFDDAEGSVDEARFVICITKGGEWEEPVVLAASCRTGSPVGPGCTRNREPKHRRVRNGI
jgi:hypothetical protein